MRKIQKEFTQPRADGDLLRVTVTWEYPPVWTNWGTGETVDPWVQMILPKATAAIAAGAAKPGDLVAVTASIQHELVKELRDYQPLSLEVLRLAAPDVRMIWTM